MGGEIRVESKFGKGSTFIFEVVLGWQPDESPEPVVKVPEFSGKHVLVIDDNIDVLESMQSALESFSMQVTSARSTKDGLELLKSGALFDLLFLDWNMPGDLDGPETIRRIKHDPMLRHIPAILMVSAEERLHQGENNELDGYLIKPITRSHLFDLLMEVIGSKNLLNLSQNTKGATSEVAEKLRGGHVLLVEDNEINQFVAVELLQNMGLRVSVANNGEEAIEMVKSHHFDAVLMDIQMPGLDGYETSAQIRHGQPANAPLLPIIAMTANAMESDRQKAMESGLNDYISKPVDVVQLTSVLHHWIHR
jgi:two-component system sensor histidine kinase/response regulator